METTKIWTYSWSKWSFKQTAQEIITRMGWCYDEDCDALVVNYPIEDERLFNFIFGNLM